MELQLRCRAVGQLISAVETVTKAHMRCVQSGIGRWPAVENARAKVRKCWKWGGTSESDRRSNANGIHCCLGSCERGGPGVIAATHECDDDDRVVTAGAVVKKRTGSSVRGIGNRRPSRREDTSSRQKQWATQESNLGFFGWHNHNEAS